jgi:tetratricopeptide (TPR) repeat protein
MITAMVYLPGLAGDYVFDDLPNLLNNKRLQIDSLNLESLQAASFSSGSGLLRRPISMMSFALNRYFFGVAPYSYKAVNLIIHLATGFGLFLLSRLLIGAYQRYREPAPHKSSIVWLPLIVSGLWLVHPLNLTSVLYIVQRMTGLATLFMVCGLYLYVAGRLKMFENRRGLSSILAGLILFGGLAVFSKETGALLPLYMLAVEITLFHLQNMHGRPDKTIIALFLTIVALPACVVLMYLFLHPGALQNLYNGRDFSLEERILTESRVLIFYLKMIIMPSITELGLYHDDISISRGILDPPTTLYSLIALSGLLLAGLLSLKKRPLVSLGILWFLSGHILESTILPLEIAHEHRNYLPSYGVLLAISASVAEATFRILTPTIRAAIPILFFSLFSATTWLRANQWSNNINQAIYEAGHHPNSYRATFAAGRIYARLAIQSQPGSAEKAYHYLERAAKLDQINIMPEVTQLKLSYVLGNPIKDAWFDEILYKLEHHPVTPSDITSLKELANCVGNYCDIQPEMMESIFARALKQENAVLLSIYGYYTINKRGNFDKGLQLFKRAVDLGPREPQLWINLIKLLIVMRRPDEAESTLRLFRAADTHGGNEDDYRILQQAINKLRESQSTSTQTSISGES